MQNFNKLNTIERYRELISKMARFKFNQEFICGDDAHAKIVLIQLLKLAESEIRIFAADIDNNIINDSICVEILSNFIEKGGKLSILLNDNNKKSDQLKSFSSTYKQLMDKIYIKSTSIHCHFCNDNDKKDIYFMVIDKYSYRIEMSANKKIFVCNFHNEIRATKHANSFDLMFKNERSQKIDLNF